MVSPEHSNEHGALSLLIDLDSHETSPMEDLTLASAGLKERSDLQRWVTEHPELIAPGLLLITTEFDRWEVRDHKVADRLDALLKYSASRTERTTTMSEYVVIYEQGPTGWGAYCPDLPGLGAAGKTRKEVEGLIHELWGSTSKACEIMVSRSRRQLAQPARLPSALEAQAVEPPSPYVPDCRFESICPQKLATCFHPTGSRPTWPARPRRR